MKSKQYARQLLLGAALIIALHFLIASTGVFHLYLSKVAFLDLFLLLLVGLGTLIIAPGLDKAPDNFVNRFTLLTTFQMLAVMISILILALSQVHQFRALGYHLLVVFVVLLALQATFLVRVIKQN